MKPEYVNTFGLRKVADKEGNALEITLDLAHKYMETSMAVTNNGVENISTPAADTVASVIMTRQSALSLCRLLVQTLEQPQE